MVIDLFSFRKARPFDPSVPEHKAAFERLVSAIPNQAPHLIGRQVESHCRGCRVPMFLAVSRKRFFKHSELLVAVAGTEKVTTYVEPVKSALRLSPICCGRGQRDPTSLFRRTARHLSGREASMYVMPIWPWDLLMAYGLYGDSLVVVDPEAMRSPVSTLCGRFLCSDLARSFR